MNLPDTDTILITGLGNPGKEYSKTRHNAGFLFVDFLREKFNEELSLSELWKFDSKFEANVCSYNLENKKVFLQQPLTTMNVSGRSVAKMLNWLKLEPSSLILVHDDLDLKLGNYKVQLGKGPLIHNGVNSVENSLHTQDFWRIRIGIDNRDENQRLMAGADYVLSKFTKEEFENVKATFNSITIPSFAGNLLN
ncbi:aminoacyl-tRNA hydrolase [Candidatus Dojkabacteria bacterium]|uniref:Peptidyl-tRNA hydrolase n=1 Tax=Candidatus Dojkabacteria bacterium TaxID=2099670 RepID=A0A955L4H1_9BACT|nr:aminoacyl-tRNA hydrolase [Candidatus Dojkabacteria bacterium]